MLEVEVLVAHLVEVEVVPEEVEEEARAWLGFLANLQPWNITKHNTFISLLPSNHLLNCQAAVIRILYSVTTLSFIQVFRNVLQ